MSPARTGWWRPAKARSLTTAIVLACSLAACSPAGTGLQEEAARKLQVRVLGVSQSAAGGDHVGGLAALDGLESDLAAAVSNGQVSEDRRRTIMTAAAAVRADLTAAKVEAEAAAASAAEEAAAAQRQAEADAAAAAAQPVQVAPAPPPPGPTDGKGGDGKGKGRDGG